MSELKNPPTFHLSNGEVIPVAIISLKDQIERRNKLTELGIPQDWVENYSAACDLRGFTDDEARKYVNTEAFLKRYGFLEGPSQIGCAMSHRALTDWLVKSDSSMMLIFEDDILPVDDNFLKTLDDICCQVVEFAKLDASFILHLGVDGDTHLRLKRRIKSSSRSGVGKAAQVFELTDLTSGQLLTHAYIVSRQAAAQTAAQESQISSKIDWWLDRKWLGHFDSFFFTHPPVFIQNPALESTIEADREKHEAAPKSLKKKKNKSTSLRKAIVCRIYQSVAFRSRRLARRILSNFPRYIP